jgi:hypothetical protein
MNPVSFIQKAFVLFDHSVELWHKKVPSPQGNSLYNKILLLHLYNFRIWHYEDEIRNPKAKLTSIAKFKKKIDRNNQYRNNQIEIIDSHFVNLIRKKNIKTQDNIPGFTENPGSTLDRMSILSLRMYHLKEELNRRTCDINHKTNVNLKLITLFNQKSVLLNNFKYQLVNIFHGKASLRPFFAIKLYNNPKLNPSIYKNLTSEKKK